jgi:hypothetical protein
MRGDRDAGGTPADLALVEQQRLAVGALYGAP